MPTLEDHLELRRRLNDYFPGRTPIDLDRLNRRQLKREAWRLCSLCVRMESMTESGLVICVTCGMADLPFGGVMQAGHVVAGRGNAILFDERGIAAQCGKCNVLESGRHAEFVLWMQANRPGVVEELIKKKQTMHLTWTSDEYIEMIQEYELRLAKYL